MEYSNFRSHFYELNPTDKLSGFFEKLCLGNWTLLLGLRVIRILLRAKKNGIHFDVLYFHTQVGAVLPLLWMWIFPKYTVPIVVSMDATPLQLDRFGKYYGHTVSRIPGAEQVKREIMRWLLNRSSHLITLSNWCKNSLIKDYHISEKNISVIHPGISWADWGAPSPVNHLQLKDVLRIIFVGNDFKRKGGELLLKVFLTHFQPQCELTIVSNECINYIEAEKLAGVEICNDVDADSEQLIALYQKSDIFVMPTLADMSSHAIVEAMTRGLAIVVSDVGGISDLVRDEKEAIQFRQVMRKPLPLHSAGW